MDPIREHIDVSTRRHFFGRMGALSLGSAALADLLAGAGLGADAAKPGAPGGAAPTGGLPGLPHFAPKAKRAIYLHMNGGPSQMDLLDYKPAMAEWYDRTCPSRSARASG
jgi:hypothetical protein